LTRTIRAHTNPTETRPTDQPAPPDPAMLKLAALAACTALVAAQKITNEKGSLIMTTDETGKVGYKVGSADPVFLNDMVTNDAASEGASYMHLGYQSAYAAEMKGIEAKIATAQAAHDAQLKANNAVQDEIDTMAAGYKTKFGDAAKALKDKINVAANSAGSSNAFVAVAQKCQGTDTDTCGTVGGQVLPLGVSGEVYANVRGLFKCKWDWKAGKQQPITTAGTGQAASATGAYSVVMCETPVFSQAFLTAVGKVSKNKMSTEITITQVGSEVKYTGKVGANVAEFQTINPEFIVDAASGFAAEGSTDTATLATAPTEVNQIMVHDPDSTSASLKFTFAGVDTTHIKKLEAVKVSEADSKVHYSIRATGTGKKSRQDDDHQDYRHGPERRHGPAGLCPQDIVHRVCRRRRDEKRADAAANGRRVEQNGRHRHVPARDVLQQQEARQQLEHPVQ